MKPDEAVEETRDVAPVYVDAKTSKILHLMGAQTNPQLKFNLVDLTARRYKMNKGDITLEQGAFLVNDNINEFSEGFINFLTNPNVTNGDIDADENKIKRFLFDVGYDIGKADKKSSRYRTIKSIVTEKDIVFVRGLTKDKLDNHSCNSSNNLTERLELLILETKAGHDGLCDEILNISKQLLSMNVINKEQLVNFVFYYGKLAML